MIKIHKAYYSLPEAEKELGISRWKILNMVVKLQLRTATNRRGQIRLSDNNIKRLKKEI